MMTNKYQTYSPGHALDVRSLSPFRAARSGKDPIGCRRCPQTPPPSRTPPPAAPAEVDAFLLHGVVIAPEVIGLQEQENPSATLVADKAFLPLV